MKFIDNEDGVEKFTCILNSFFTDYKDDKNKIDELYQYYFLSEYRLLNNKKYAYMSINLIVHSGLKLVSDERRNLLRVKEILLTLKSKGYLGFEIGDKFDYNTPLLISFNKEPDINKKDNFTMLYRWMFEASNDSKEFFVYAYIEKWSGISDYKISLNEWADVLGYSNASSVQRYLTKLEKDKKLIVEHGQYILQNRQDMNKYSMNKEVLKDDAKVNSHPVSINEDDEVLTNTGMKTIREIDRLVKWSNWGLKNEGSGGYKTIEQSDYDIYRICLDNSLHTKKVRNWANKILKMKASEDYNGSFDEYEEFYNKQINKEKEREMLKDVKHALDIDNCMVIVDKNNIDDYELTMDTLFYIEPKSTLNKPYPLAQFCNSVANINDEVREECIRMFVDHVKSEVYLTSDEAVRMQERMTNKFSGVKQEKIKKDDGYEYEKDYSL